MESLHDAQQVKEQAQAMFDLGLLDLEREGEDRNGLLADRAAGRRVLRGDEIRAGRGARSSRSRSAISTSATSPSSSRCSITGRSGSSSRSCRSTGSTRIPERQATLVDITCDSDGKVSKFIDLQDVKDTLPLHKLRPGEPYLLGFFLMGAYQDIMGDLHNLFGRVNEVHVFLDEDEESGWYIEETIGGTTIGEVLAMTQWDKAEIGAAGQSAGGRGDQKRSAQAERSDEAARRVRARAAGVYVSLL